MAQLLTLENDLIDWQDVRLIICFFLLVESLITLLSSTCLFCMARPLLWASLGALSDRAGGRTTPEDNAEPEGKVGGLTTSESSSDSLLCCTSFDFYFEILV